MAGINRPFLMVGGPLHAEMQRIAMTADAEPRGGEHPESQADLFPLMWTHIESASNYVRRNVAHVSNGTGQTYGINVYVWEGVEGPEQGQMLLGDAMTHQYFVQHGYPAVAPTNGAPSKLILPGK